MWFRAIIVLVGFGLSASLALAAPRDEQASIKQQYEDLVRCKATFGAASNTSNNRSRRAIKTIDARLSQLALGKSEEQILNDVALQSAKLGKFGLGQFLDSLWKPCLSRYAGYGLKDKIDLAQKLFPRSPITDRIAAARIVLAAPEKYSSLLLMASGEPLLRIGEKDDARFLYYVGVLRVTHLGMFLDVRADQDMIQVMNWTRRGYGIPFVIDGLVAAHDTRLAVEHAAAWDRVSPNPELADALADADDTVAAERKMSLNRCNYVVSYYFNESAASVEIKERYDGDVERFEREMTADLSRLGTADRTRRDGVLTLFSARQKSLTESAKGAIIKASFGGDKSAYEASVKNDPIAACEMLLTEAKKLVQ